MKMKKILFTLALFCSLYATGQNATSIITNKDVDYTVDSQPCRLMRTIVRVEENPTKKYRKYVILNERVKFVTLTEVCFDENGDEQTCELTKLVAIDKKDQEVVRIYQYDEIDHLYSIILDLIPENISSYTRRQDLEKQLALLVITQQDTPYNTNAQDWVVYGQTAKFKRKRIANKSKQRK